MTNARNYGTIQAFRARRARTPRLASCDAPRPLEIRVRPKTLAIKITPRVRVRVRPLEPTPTLDMLLDMLGPWTCLGQRPTPIGRLTAKGRSSA